MATDEATQLTVIEAMKSLLAETGHTSVQLFAAQLFLQASLVKDALSCVHLGVTMEHICTTLHIYIQMDRLDLAKEQLSLLKQADEDAVLTQLASVQVALATGSSTAKDAIHTLQTLSEQYGPSPLLLNLFAASYMTSSQYEEAPIEIGRMSSGFYHCPSRYTHQFARVLFAFAKTNFGTCRGIENGLSATLLL